MGSHLVDHLTLHYFEQLDPDKTGRIQAGDAANFLRSSGIADGDLAVIWDHADRNKCGALDVLGLATALKLVALVQNGNPPSTENLSMVVPAAKFAGYPPPQVSGSATPERAGTPPSRPSRPAVPGRTSEAPQRPPLRRIRCVNGEAASHLQVSNHAVAAARSPPLVPRDSKPTNSSPGISTYSSPVISKPTNSSPGMSKPTNSNPVIIMSKPITQSPVMSRPTNQSPAMSKPTNQSPAISKPTNQSPVMSKPTNQSPGMSKPTNQSPGIPSRDDKATTNPPKVVPNFVMDDKGGEPAWVVSQQYKSQYDSIFHSLNPINQKLSGNKVKPILQKSGLHVKILGQIWELSDVDRDGALDIEEFSLAMFLLNRARQGEAPPTVLPRSYIPPSHRVVYTKVQKVIWAVPVTSRRVASEEFMRADTRQAGVLSGVELRTLLISKGVPTVVLAKIWGLCDILSTGKLNIEQYALALHLIELHKQGSLPETLPLELIPPSLRSGAAPPAPLPAASGSPHLPPRNTATLPSKQLPPRNFPDKTATLGPNVNRPQSSPGSSLASTSIPDELASLNFGSHLDNADFSVIKELDTYTKETDSLTKEKKDLQTEIKQTEQSLSTAGEELKDLKKQVEKYEEEVTVARRQRDEAQARLDEADAERRKYEELLADLHKKAMNERQQISVLQQQIASQDALRKSQGEELQKARDELQKLRQEESHYLHQVESGKRQLDTLIQNLKLIQSDTNLSQSKLVQIESAHRTVDKALAELAPFGKRGPGVEGKPSILTNIHEVSQLRRQEQDVTQMSDITRATAGSSPVSSMSGFSVDSYMDPNYENKAEAVLANSNPFGPSAGAADPFQTDVDPFGGSDPFKVKPGARKGAENNGGGAEEPRVQSATNTPQLHRKNQHSSDSITLKNDQDDIPFKAPSGGNAANPFETTDDPFKAPGFDKDPFASNPFEGGCGSDPFGQKSTDDPFGDSEFKTVTADNDPFSSGNVGGNSDPFVITSVDPFASPSTTEDPFGGRNYEEDPFQEKNLFTSEVDAFNTHDPFANTHDPFAGSEDLFKGSNNSLASKGTRGSKNSLVNFGGKPFGSKTSLQGSKTSLNTADSSPKLQLKGGEVTTPEETPEFVKSPLEGASSDQTSRSDDHFETPAETPDPFANNQNDPFTNSNMGQDPFAGSGFDMDPFGGSNGPDDPFGPSAKSDPFGDTANDPFGSSNGDPFTAKFDGNDPFAASSADQGSTDLFSNSNQNSNDPFDPFGSSGAPGSEPGSEQGGFAANFS